MPEGISITRPLAIAKRYGTVVIEDLNVRGMVRDGSLAKGVTDQGWYQFREMLEYKLEWRGGELIEMGRFDPSSKMCSRCADILSPLKVEVPAPSTVPPSSFFQSGGLIPSQALFYGLISRFPTAREY